MAISVREASLIDDEGLLSDLAHRFLDSDADDKRFQWLYRDNPFGAARAWIAYENHGEAIGMAAIFPRKMYRDRDIVPACILGDLCISPKYRSVGPALQLQRSCLLCARSGEFAIAYDFPSATMLTIYGHLGLQPIGESIRMSKTLWADKKVESIFRAPALSRPIAAGVNVALALGNRRLSRPTGLDFSLETVPCGIEYSELARRVGSSLGTCTVRSAEYLNWRYRRHPRRRYEFLSARQGDELLTYCTFTVSDGIATVADLFGDMEPRVVTGLLLELSALLRERGVASVNLPVLESDSRTGLLRKLGFWAREAVPVMCFAGESTLSSSEVFLMHGDRES